MFQDNLALYITIIAVAIIIIAIFSFMSKRRNKFIELSLTNLANKVLKENTETLNKSNFERLQETLAPFKEQISQLNNQIIELKQSKQKQKKISLFKLRKWLSKQQR